MDSKRKMAQQRKEAQKQDRPFEHQPDDRDSNLVEARDHVEQAIFHLENAMQSAENWGDYGSLTYFKNELAEFMSSDDGEAGFSIYR